MSYQTPMISSPLKQTVEVDWIQPLRNYIQNSYGADPNTYSEECTRLNQLRQDMRGAGKDSIAGRDLLYRYYGQLELLELRFPVDEHHIKVTFTWYDAFTSKTTSQYSLAFEKASVIYNIAAVLSCHAANQIRHEEIGLKAAFHSFQAAAGMFTYINENFLHAPSTDLSRETVKTLTQIMLGQAQEVLVEKQIEDGKKPALLAKLANQGAYHFVQAVEGTQENVDKGVFSRSWLHIVQAKASYLGALANHFQASADEEAGSHGAAISRWQAALDQIQQALSFVKSLPSSFSSTANLGSETTPAFNAVFTRYLTTIREKLNQANKDNDFLYHEIVPSESTLPRIAKLPAAKPIPISELYQNQDVSRIVGPDIFARIIPMPVTEASSIYEEEKARLLRAEAEKVDTANSEMLAALDYLKIPDIIPVLKGQVQENSEPSPEVVRFCKAIADGGLLREQLDSLRERETTILSALDRCTTDLDREESTCEKMRLKFGAEWTQQPSAKFSATLKNEMKRYRTAINEASANDSTLMTWWERSEQLIREMYTAGLNNEVDVMFQAAMIKAAEKTGRGTSANSTSPVGNLLDDVDDSDSVDNQVAQIEELYRKLMLVKKDRSQVLKDLKEKIHADDISQVLLLNKKTLSGQENQIFQSELEKFRAHQTRLTQSNHKQVSLLKEITKVYEGVLQNDRVRAEQAKYDAIAKQRSTIFRMYEQAFKAYKDISDGLQQADKFYTDMRNQAQSLQKNVEEFLSNRKAEGSQLLQELERKQQTQSAVQGDQDREKLNQLMNRLS
ncbi:bck1-like resistance to osmotic shock, partial [Ascosphaera pollenicola]